MKLVKFFKSNKYRLGANACYMVQIVEQVQDIETGEMVDVESYRISAQSADELKALMDCEVESTFKKYEKSNVTIYTFKKVEEA